MKRHILSVLAAFGCILSSIGNDVRQAPLRVATDCADYPPGGIVSISGAGFAARETIRLQILRIDVADNDRPEHQPWSVQADVRGAFAATWEVTAHEAGAKLLLTATGVATGRMANTFFSDAVITPASGGGAIPADSYNGAYTALTGPVIVETIVGDISVGTLVLTTPAGFVFDTNAPLPFITLNGDNNSKNINGLSNGAIIPLTVATNSLSFTVSIKSHGQTRNTLTYSNLRVRPTAPAPLPSGNITNTGTATFPGSTTNFGTLTEIAGALTHLAVSGFPSPQTAGVPAGVTVAAQDQFGNVVPTYTGTIHFTSSDPLAVLPADYTFVSGDNGTHTFSGIALKTIGTQSITASNLAVSSFSGSQSGISIIPTAADHLAFATQPGSAVYGSLLNPQPVIVTQDAYSNNSQVGLPSSKIVSLTLTSGSGSLIGTASLDIGTAAGNGAVTFTNLTVNAAGPGKQLTATATGLSNALSSSFTITQATLTASVTVSNKVYDATTGAVIGSRTLAGVLGGDNVTLTGGTAAFASKSVGNGKTVNVTGLALGGPSAANYALASTTATTTANITPAALGITGVTADNKFYDGMTKDALSSTAALSGVFSGDSVTLGGTPTASFADKLVGNNKPVTVTGYSISGPDAANYTLAQPTGLTANISASSLTVSGITAADKVYNGNTSVVLNAAGAALAGVFGSDIVALNIAGATGGFVTKNAGTNKPVTVTGLTISGADAGNYTLTQPTGVTASISAAGLTVSGISASNKVYDGTTVATLNTGGAALVGVLGGDAVTLNTLGASGAFANKTVGTGKTVTVTGLALSGADALNYALTQPAATANITQAPLTVSATGIKKLYDGATAATVTLSDNRVSGDSLTTSYATAAFADKNAGNGKTVNVSGISISGTDASNYSANTTATTLANIMPATLTGTAGNQSRLYGAANPPFTVTYSGFVNGENPNIVTGALTFTTTATTNSPVGSYPITPSGQTAPNYSVQYVAGTLTVNPAPLMTTAGDATRGYGQPNPSFTATIAGFVNAEGTNVLGGALAFTTPAQPTSPPGNYPIVPGGLLSANYSISYSNGTLNVTTTNHPPVLASISNAVVCPDQWLVFKVYGSDPDGDALSYSLDPGAPAGAIITNVVRGLPFPATNTVFRWRPTRAQASTTNLITVRVTDNGGPPMSSTQTFTVIVLDYLEITVGSTNVQSDQTVAVPIYVASSDGVTNFAFNLQWPSNYLANASLTATAPALGSLQDQGTNLAFAFQAAPGQVLQGTQQVANLSFTALTNPYSAFLSLPIATATAAKPDGSAYTNYVTPSARIVVIEGQPLLWGFLSNSFSRELTLYGRLGYSYQLQYSTDLANPNGWGLWWSYVQTNGQITIGVDSVYPTIFYRLFQP